MCIANSQSKMAFSVNISATAIKRVDGKLQSSVIKDRWHVWWARLILIHRIPNSFVIFSSIIDERKVLRFHKSVPSLMDSLKSVNLQYATRNSLAFISCSPLSALMVYTNSVTLLCLLF